MSNLEKKILSIVDKDIAKVFQELDSETFAPKLPLDMQLVRTFKSFVDLLRTEQAKDSDNSPDDSGNR